MKKFYRTQLTKSISMALAGSVVAVTLVVPVQAQDDKSMMPDDSIMPEDSSMLEEVIVTAQKREQSLQDVARFNPGTG